jgi:hypothetical protein
MTEPLPVGVGPAQLTKALRRASALPGDASVREITVENARSTILSRIFRLRLSYWYAVRFLNGSPQIIAENSKIVVHN